MKIPTYLAILLHLFFQSDSQAQSEPKLYLAMFNSKGYMPGGAVAKSGLYRFGGDTSWSHIGWNHPRVYGIAVDPMDAGIIYLACGNGVLRSRDGGESWRLTTGWQITEALDVAVDPNSPQHLYLATAYGLWRSLDRGDSWLEINQGLVQKFSQTLKLDRNKAGHLFAGTEGGLFKRMSSDSCWSIVGPEDVTVLDIQQSVTNADFWLAGTQNDGVLLSADNGNTWRRASGSIAEASIYSVAIDPFDARKLAAAGWNTGVFISKDGGDRWDQITEGLPTANVYKLIFEPMNRRHLWVATAEQGIFVLGSMDRSWRYRGMSGALVFDMLFAENRDHASHSN